MGKLACNVHVFCRRDRSQRDGGRDRENARAGWLDLPRDGERERGRQQRSPQVWRHDMFEKLQREDEREGEGEGEEGSEEEEEDLKDSRKRRYSHTLAFCVLWLQ